MAAPSADYEMAIAVAEGEYYAMDDADMGAGGTLSGMTDVSGSDIMPVSDTNTGGLAEKIIYTVYAEIESLNFDETINNVNALMESYGAFVENSTISGINHASIGWNNLRYAFFTIRVPVERLNAMTANLDALGNVVRQNMNADNITSQFFDTQSRLNSLTIQEERLLDMLRQADEVPDLIMIESRLSEVRYQIEALTTTLNNWQRQVDYSYLTLDIREVEQFTEIDELTYWQQIGEGLVSTLKGIGRFFMNLFKWLIVSAPVLLILAVIAIVTFIIIRRKLRKMKKKVKQQPYQVPPGAPPVYPVPPYPNLQQSYQQQPYQQPPAEQVRNQQPPAEQPQIEQPPAQQPPAE